MMIMTACFVANPKMFFFSAYHFASMWLCQCFYTTCPVRGARSLAKVSLSAFSKFVTHSLSCMYIEKRCPIQHIAGNNSDNWLVGIAVSVCTIVQWKYVARSKQYESIYHVSSSTSLLGIACASGSYIGLWHAYSFSDGVKAFQHWDLCTKSCLNLS